jgi:hypothetical protein
MKEIIKKIVLITLILSVLGSISYFRYKDLQTLKEYNQ